MLGVGTRQSTLPVSTGPPHRVSRPAARSRWRHSLLQGRGRQTAAGVTFLIVLLVLLWSLGGSGTQQAFADRAQLHSKRPAASLTPADEAPQCRLFQPPKRAPWAFNIAIVGNEPLTNAYRRELHGMNITVRIDGLRGLQAGDPFTTWVLQAQQPNSTTVEPAEAVNWQAVTQAMSDLKAVLVFGGQEDSVSTLQQQLGATSDLDVDLVHLPRQTWYEQRWLDMPAGGRPTTGYVALRTAMFCKPPVAMIHLYGFRRGWRKDPAEAAKALTQQHDDPEAVILLTLDRRKITIHETAVNA